MAPEFGTVSYTHLAGTRALSCRDRHECGYRFRTGSRNGGNSIWMSGAIALTVPHSGYRLNEASASQVHQAYTLEVTEDELRRCMMPRSVALPDGQRMEFEKGKKSHCGRVRSTGG